MTISSSDSPQFMSPGHTPGEKQKNKKTGKKAPGKKKLPFKKKVPGKKKSGKS